MKEDIRDFIGVFENAIEDSWCDSVIDFYKKVEISSPDLVLNRQIHENTFPGLMKNNYIFMEQHLDTPPTQNLYNYFFSKLHPCITQYINRYYIFNDNNLSATTIKVQKTSPEEGYHVWHYENMSIELSTRKLVYMVYLNDVEEGGETEFLHQKRRVKPKKGTILLFPPSFTHTHRGNPPLSGDKYAITGWVVHTEPNL
jgi:hypothetical protein